MSPARWTVPALLLAALAAPAYAAGIDDALPGQRPPAGSDEDELWYAMERAETELRRSPLLVRDPALNAYVRDVACKVAGDHCGDLRVYVMDVPQFNASMAPNGMMLVWTGALLRIHEATVIDADFGYAGGQERSGGIRLQAGLHPFRLYYVHGTQGAPSLKISWSGPGLTKETIPDAVFQRAVEP